MIFRLAFFTTLILILAGPAFAQDGEEYSPPRFEHMGRAEFNKYVANISDEDFFAAVDLSGPRMQKVREAAAKKDYPAAYMAMKEEMAGRGWPIFSSPPAPKGFFSTLAFKIPLAAFALAIGAVLGGFLGRKLRGAWNVAPTVSTIAGGLAGLGLCLVVLFLLSKEAEPLSPGRREAADSMCERAAEFDILDEAGSQDISRYSTLHFL
ncbi:MAG: hypothetical protein QGD94_07710, partial [Planctomycetia bacterium]|nr:hypothetical protein [Planctomycetia bacterium]